MNTKHTTDTLKTRGNIKEGENKQPSSLSQPKKQWNKNNFSYKLAIITGQPENYEIKKLFFRTKSGLIKYIQKEEIINFAIDTLYKIDLFTNEEIWSID